MHRTLPALIALTLAACSGGGSSSSTTTGSGSGPGGSVTGSGASSSGGATGGSSTGNQGTTTGGNGGGVTVDNFNALFNQAACKFVYSCSEGSTYAPYVLDAVCPDLVQFDMSDLPLAVDAGRIRFDPTEATACLAGLNEGICSEIPILPCVPFLDGTNGLVPPAGACYADADCLSGSCTGNTSSTCMPGTCAGLVAAGGACDCTNCGECDPDAGLTCANSVCTASSGVGQPCGNSDPSCQFDLACPDNTCESVPISAGNPCDRGSGECSSGLYCFEKVSANFGNCATLVAAGQPCGEDADHQSNIFSEIDNECAGAHPVCLGAGTLMDSGVAPGMCSEYSDMSGSCTPPNAGIDTTKPYNNGCYAGLNCRSGACVKPPSSGTCSTDGIPCDPTQSYCASATNNCTPFIALGGTCTGTDNGECGLSASCNANNICQGSSPSCSPTL